MDALNQHYINGKDLYAAFGIFVTEGSDRFLEFPARKPSIEHDWGDTDGIDKDLSTPTFQSRNITLKCGIIANDPADFWLKHRLFFQELAKPGLFRLTVAAFDKDFYCYYIDCNGFTRYTKLKGGKVACKFSLIIVEQLPEINNDTGTADNIITDDGDDIIA